MGYYAVGGRPEKTDPEFSLHGALSSQPLCLKGWESRRQVQNIQDFNLQVKQCPKCAQAHVQVLVYLHRLNNRVIYTFQAYSCASSPFPLTISLAVNVGELNLT